MNILVKAIAAMSLCLCFCGGAFAQEHKDFDSYIDASGKNAVLFRGKRAFSYNVLYNGHCYWKSPEFLRGELLYNGKHYHSILLNIDACRHEVLAKSSDIAMPVVLVSDAIGYFTMGDERFERIQGRSKKKLPQDFCQILYRDGHVTVYKRVYKVFTSNTLYNNGSVIGYDDPKYDSRVLNFFQYNVRYYCLRDGTVKRIGKGKARKLSGRL